MIVLLSFILNIFNLCQPNDDRWLNGVPVMVRCVPFKSNRHIINLCFHMCVCLCVLVRICVSHFVPENMFAICEKSMTTLSVEVFPFCPRDFLFLSSFFRIFSFPLFFFIELVKFAWYSHVSTETTRPPTSTTIEKTNSTHPIRGEEWPFEHTIRSLSSINETKTLISFGDYRLWIVDCTQDKR